MNEMASVTIPSEVDPEKLTSLLRDAGWHSIGGRPGVYTRYAPPATGEAENTAKSLLIPLNQSAPDFADLMHSSLLQLSEDQGLWTRSIYPRLAVDATDEFRFRKESEAPSGLIPWRHGEKLVESARRTLLAGAKYYMGPGRHFVNKHGRFAGRYLDHVLMGQTAPGSYIVTAYAPPNASVPLHGGSETIASVLEVGTAQVRAVNEAVVRAVESTVEALDHYRTSGSLSGFEDRVAHGISYEMVSALMGMTSSSSEADITVEWDGSRPSVTGLDNRFTFHPSDLEPLSHAAAKLAEDKSTQVVTLMGRVHLLAKKQAGSPGVFGIDSLQAEGPRKVRVRLADEEDYHEAVRAHDEDLALLVSGSLEKEGNLSWLYHATVIRTLGHVDEYLVRRPNDGPIPGQIDLFDPEA